MALLAGQVQTTGYQAPDYNQVIRANALANAQQQQMIGDLAGQAKDYFKQQGEKKKLVKQSSLQIDAALQLFPDLAPSFQGLKERMRDENIPLADRAAEAEVVANLINMGVGEMRNRSKMSIEQEQAMAEAIYKEQQLGMEERRTRATEFSAAQGAKPTFDLQKATITSPDGETFEMDIPYDKEKGMFFDPDAGKYIKDVNKWGFGESSYVDGEAMPTPTSQNAPSGQINQSALSSPLRQYAQSFEEYGNKYGVDPTLLAAIAEHETGGGKSLAFKNKNNAMGVSNASGPIKMASVEASIEKMASLLGRGINEGKGPYANAKSIEDIGRKYAPIGAGNDPGNLNKFWTRGVSSKYEKLATPKQIDGALSMSGDMSQQAMGTPDQQAEVARMIGEGSGMATSQAAPSGAMPTEPRMTQPQPTQQAPQYKVRPGFVPVGNGASSKFRPANAEEVSMYGTQGQVNVETGQFTPIRPASGMVIEQTPGGGFRVVQGAGATDRFAQASKEAEKQKLQAADRNIQDLMEAKRLYSSVMQSKGVIPAAVRKLEAGTPGTELHAIQKDIIEPFKNRLGLEQLTQLRQASPTGAAVGNPTNAEGQRLESVFGSLDPTASPTIFNRNLNRAIESYLDVIHGTPEQRDKLMEEGKITAKQNAQIEMQYPSSTMDTMGIEQPRQTGGTGNPAIDEIIQRNNIQIK
jgi:hypothetical protein